MLASSSNHLSMTGSARAGGGGTPGATLAGSTFTAPAPCPLSGTGGAVSSSSTSSKSIFKCVSFMRHSIATHNEAAATSPDAMNSVYLNEAYADSSLSHRGHNLVRGARHTMEGLSPSPDVVLCSPLTRAIQTAIAMFGGTGIPIMAVPEVREAYGRFPCDRHRDRSELELMFGEYVDFSMCPPQDTLWSPQQREDMSQLNNRVTRFLERIPTREEGHVFIVSHGVFMEAAIRQLTDAYPGHSSGNRVHNCEVHSFTFMLPPTLAPSTTATPSATTTPSASMGLYADDNIRGSTLTANNTACVANFVVATGGATAVGGIGARPKSITRSPRVESYLTGQALTLACAARMPLPYVAHINRVLRCYSADWRCLTEAQLSVLLSRCGLGPQETRWLFCALDREGGGKVAIRDISLALIAFYRAEEGISSATRANSVLMDLRMRYQREMYGTPLANYELLEGTFHRILSTMLSIG